MRWCTKTSSRPTASRCSRCSRPKNKPPCAHLRSARHSSPLVSLRSGTQRSEEHTSELQSLTNLVCRLLLEKKKCSHSVPPSQVAVTRKRLTGILQPHREAATRDHTCEPLRRCDQLLRMINNLWPHVTHSCS